MKRKSISVLKAMTREQLLGNYSKLSAYVALLILIQFTLTNVILQIRVTGLAADILSSLIHSLLLSIFTVGFIRVCMLTVRGQSVNLKEFFYGFQHDPDKIIIISFVQWIFATLVQIPLIIPDSAAETLGFGEGALMLVRCILTAGFLVLYIFAYILLSQCYFLYLDHPELGARDIILHSVSVMNDHKGRFFYLLFNVFCMACLIVLTMGIGIFWLLPNIYVLMINFYEDVFVGLKLAPQLKQ